MNLSNAEMEQYARQLILPEFGVQAQEKLKQASVLVIGAGGLGCPVLQYLTAAGVGKIGIVDADVVSVSNLHRQVLFSKEDVGQLKVEVAFQFLQRQNALVEFELFPEHLSTQNALELIAPYDVICDCTDNFAARYLINDACVLLQKPFVSASILRFQGQLSVFNHQTQLHYRDIFPEPPQKMLNCAEAGVVGALCGIMGSMQANEVIKVITGIGQTLEGKLWCLDVLENKIQILKIVSSGIKITALQQNYDVVCANQTVEYTEISATQLQKMLDEQQDFQLIDVREKWENDIVNLGGNLIPLSTLETNLSQINTQLPIVVYCKSGARSLKAVELLHQKGFTNCSHLKGGLIAYQKEINPQLPLY